MTPQSRGDLPHLRVWNNTNAELTTREWVLAVWAAHERRHPQLPEDLRIDPAIVGWMNLDPSTGNLTGRI